VNLPIGGINTAN